MVLEKMVAIFDWEWCRYLAPRERQKTCMVCLYGMSKNILCNLIHPPLAKYSSNTHEKTNLTQYFCTLLSSVHQL